MPNKLNSLAFSGIALSVALSLSSSILPALATNEVSDSDCNYLVREVSDRQGHKMLTIKIVINASPQVVWQAIREAREDDPDVQYSKITQISETQRILEQKYVALPVVGSTTCVIKVEESSGRRVDYKLMQSDRLAEFDGSWVLTPIQEQRATVLEISNHIRLKFPLPQKIVDIFASKKLKTRAEFVKRQAEAAQLHIAANPS
ncbi:MAG: SRPBCC family protein [Candidatus Obscuribacterales bacterium]|nr:SRPBCC family protein [Candidatus Obscuribacterales bacterium]